MRSETIKGLEENIGRIFFKIILNGKGISKQDTKPRSHKGNTDEFDYVRILNSV